MPQAVGSLETKGFPPVLAAADAMVKAGRVTLIGYIRAGSARFVVNIRGDVSEVKQAMAAMSQRGFTPASLKNYTGSAATATRVSTTTTRCPGPPARTARSGLSCSSTRPNRSVIRWTATTSTSSFEQRWTPTRSVRRGTSTVQTQRRSPSPPVCSKSQGRRSTLCLPNCACTPSSPSPGR